MSILSKEDKGKYALAHGRLFAYSCDTPSCGRLIKEGELCVILKWKKRTDGMTFLGRIPEKVRCMVCERELHPPKEEVKVKAAGRGAKKVSPEIAATIQINAMLRKFVLSLLKKAGDKGIPVTSLKMVIRKKKAVRELPKKEIALTLKGMRKLKLFRRKGPVFVLPKAKKVKQKVTK